MRADLKEVKKATDPDFVKRRTYEHNRAYFENQRAQPGWREMKQERDRAYRLTAKGQANLLRARGKRRAQGGTHDLSGVEWEATLLAFDQACAYCGSMEKIQVDHFIPIEKGGNTVKGNVLPCCRECNRAKSDQAPEEWCSAPVFQRIIGVLRGL